MLIVVALLFGVLFLALQSHERLVEQNRQSIDIMIEAQQVMLALKDAEATRTTYFEKADSNSLTAYEGARSNLLGAIASIEAYRPNDIDHLGEGKIIGLIAAGRLTRMDKDVEITRSHRPPPKMREAVAKIHDLDRDATQGSIETIISNHQIHTDETWALLDRSQRWVSNLIAIGATGYSGGYRARPPCRG